MASDFLKRMAEQSRVRAGGTATREERPASTSGRVSPFLQRMAADSRKRVDREDEKAYGGSKFVAPTTTTTSTPEKTKPTLLDRVQGNLSQGKVAMPSGSPLASSPMAWGNEERGREADVRKLTETLNTQRAASGQAEEEYAALLKRFGGIVPHPYMAEAEGLRKRAAAAWQEATGTERALISAQRAADASRYGVLSSKPEFRQYADRGASLPTPTPQEAEGGLSMFGWRPFGKEPENIVSYTRANAKRFLNSDSETRPTVGNPLYLWMEKDEVDTYNYLLAKDGKEAASSYLDWMEETLNARMGQEQGAQINKIENPVGRIVGTVGTGASAGVDQWASGVRQLASREKRLPTSAAQFAAAEIDEGLSDVGPKILGRSLGQMGFGAVRTVSNMAPSILLSTLTAGAGAPAAVTSGVSLGSMGAGAVGNAYNQALGEGYGKNEAMNYAALVGASEVGLQYLLGGIGALGGKATGKVVETTVRNIDNALLRIAGTMGVKMFGEGTEEYLQEILEPAFRNLAFDENNEIKLVTEEAAYSFLMGALTAGLLEGGGVVRADMANTRTGTELRGMGQDVTQAVISEGLLSDPSTESYQQAESMKRRREAGKPVSDAALGELYHANVEAVSADGGDALASRKAGTAETSRPVDTPTPSLGAVGAESAARAAMFTAMVREGKAVGTRGKAAFSATYDGAVDIAPFYGEFMQYYNAGVSGQKMDKVSSRYGDTLSQEQRFVAWKAGGDDASASLSEEQRNAKLVTVYSEGGGLVRGGAAEGMDTNTADLVDRMGKALGVKVVVDATISSPDGRASGANGYYRDGVIHIAADADNPTVVVMKHEVTHRLQELSPESYRRFRDYAVRLAGTDTVQQMQEARLRSGENLSNEAAMDEIAANLTERLMTDRESIDRFIRDDRNAAQRFFDTLKKLVQTVKEKLGRAEPTLEQAERLWKDAFKAAEREAGKGQKNTAQEGGGTKHSLDPDFAAQFDQWMAGTTPSQRRASPGYFQIGTTSEALKSIGMDDYRIFFGKSKLEKIMEKHPAMNAEVMKSIPDVLEHPILVMQSQTVVNRVTLFGEAMDADGKPVLVALELSPQNKRGEVLDFAVIASAYGKDNAQNLIDSSHILYVEPNKNRTDSWLRLLGLQLPSRVTSYGSIDSISFVKRDVNGNLSFGEAGGNTAMREAFEQAEKRSLATTPGGASPGPQTSETISGTAPTHSIPTDEGKGNTKFSLKSPVEETKDLLALHNLTEKNLRDALELGGMPMPSVAVVKAQHGHSKYGPISLVFGKDAIDPKVSSKNRVYGGDAYTATAPRIDRIVNQDVQRRVSREIYELAGQTAGGMFRGEASAVLNFNDDYTSETLDDIADSLSRNYGVLAAYLADRGERLEPVMQDKEWDGFGNEPLKSYIDEVGPQRLAQYAVEMETGDAYEVFKGQKETVQRIVREDYRKKHESFLSRKPELAEKRIDGFIEQNASSSFRIEDFIKHAWEMYQDGGATKGDTDRYATMDALKEAADRDAVRAWLAPKLEGLLGQAGIYNGKDIFTPSGNRRGFKALHNPYTLENIVTAMASQQAERGEGVWGVSAKTLQSTATPAYASIQEMKEDSGRLGAADEDAYQARLQALDERISAILTKVKETNKAHSDNPFTETDIIGGILLEAANGRKTVDAVVRTFRKEGYTISTQTAQDVQALYREAAELPTEYFEAKPRRAVGFDEVLAAVVPDDLDAALRSNAEKAGMRVLEYKAGDDADRLAKVNSVEGARFSLKDQSPEARAARLEELNEFLRAQLKVTVGAVTDKKAVAGLARALLSEYSSDYNHGTLSQKLQALYDRLAGGDVTWEGVRSEAQAIAEEILGGSLVRNDDSYQSYEALRKYARGTQIHVPGTLWSELERVGGYNEFRKANMGRLNLSSKGGMPIDTVYKELSAQYPEFFDENEQTHPADQLIHLADVMEGLRPVMENPYSGNMREASSYLAADIIERFYETPQQKPTAMDRQERRMTAQKIHADKKLDRLRQQKNERIEAIRQQGKERVVEAVTKERERRAEQVQKLTDRFKSKEAAGRERRSAAQLRRKISKHAKELSQKLLRPSDKKHIPEELRSPVAALLEAINLESAYAVDSETGKRVKGGEGLPTKRTEAFLEIKKQYAKIAAEGGDIVVDPALFGSEEENIRGSFDLVIDMRTVKLADMTADQLETVWQVVKAVEHSVTTAGKTLSKAKFARTQDWAQALSLDASNRRSKRGNISIDLETPYTFFSHYGEAGKAIFRMLRDAQDQHQVMVNRVAEDVAKIVDPKTVAALEEETHTFTTEREDELTLSTAQVMELYELMKRKQAHDHLLKGGIVQPEVKSAKIRRGTDSILLTGEDLGNIVKVLTDEQVRMADAMQGMTTGLLAGYGNEASMAAYGYKKFVAEDYWPIKSAKEGIHSSVEKGGNQPRSIKNTGMAQAVMPHASNPLDLPGLFATFATHTADMIDYAAWLLPMEDANRLFNFQYRDGEGKQTGKTVKGLLERVGGEGAQKYWRNLMENIQNGISLPSDTASAPWVGKSIGNFKGAAVGANLRVVLQQPTAFFRAGVVLNPADLSRGMAGGVTKGNGWKKALEYSPIAMRKDVGGFDISNPLQMKEILFDSRTNLRKVNDKLSWLAGAADAVTWGRIWNACEWATAREHKGLAKGSSEFYAAVNALFTEVIDQTQVVDGVLQRSQIMRSKSDLTKQATSFMGEPIMSLNVMMRAYDQVRYEKDPVRRGKAIKRLGRAVTALVVTNVVNALAQSVVDGLRDDDEDKKYMERFWSALTGVQGDEESAWDKAVAVVLDGNLVDGMNPMGQIPFLRDALSLLKGYDVARTDMEIVSDIINAGVLAAKSAGGDGRRTRGYAVKELLAAGAKFFAIPVGNLARDVWGVARTVAVETDNIPLQYEMEKAIYNITNDENKGRYYDILFRALTMGDMDSYQHISAELMEKMGVDEKQIEAAMRARRKKTDEFASTSSDMREDVVKALEGSRGYSSLSDAQKEKALEDAKTYANVATMLEQDPGYAVPSTYSWVLKAQGGAPVGLSETEYILYRLARERADKPSEKGNLGSYTNAEIEAAINMVAGLSRREKSYLWTAQGMNEKSNPFK